MKLKNCHTSSFQNIYMRVPSYFALTVEMTSYHEGKTYITYVSESLQNFLGPKKPEARGKLMILYHEDIPNFTCHPCHDSEV